MRARHGTCMMRLVSQLLTKWFTSALLRMRRRTTSLKPLHRRKLLRKKLPQTKTNESTKEGWLTCWRLSSAAGILTS